MTPWELSNTNTQLNYFLILAGLCPILIPFNSREKFKAGEEKTTNPPNFECWMPGKSFWRKFAKWQIILASHCGCELEQNRKKWKLYFWLMYFLTVISKCIFILHLCHKIEQTFQLLVRSGPVRSHRTNSAMLQGTQCHAPALSRVSSEIWEDQHLNFF